MAFGGKLLSGVTVLIAVVEAGTIARDAEALGLSRSGVSHALSRDVQYDIRLNGVRYRPTLQTLPTEPTCAGRVST